MPTSKMDVNELTSGHETPNMDDVCGPSIVSAPMEDTENSCHQEQKDNVAPYKTLPVPKPRTRSNFIVKQSSPRVEVKCAIEGLTYEEQWRRIVKTDKKREVKIIKHIEDKWRDELQTYQYLHMQASVLRTELIEFGSNLNISRSTGTVICKFF